METETQRLQGDTPVWGHGWVVEIGPGEEKEVGTGTKGWVEVWVRKRIDGL